MQIDPEFIDPDADSVVRRLSQGGYQAYLVGGCVRDLLLNRHPKDFDVSSSATPNEIKHLFRNCRIIGRRFRLAHIFFGSKIIETATFRANPRANATDDSGELLIHRDNVWGSDTEDAQRRDFTINGLFYDVEAEIVIDHVNGLADLKKRLIRTIGEPDIRFREDPVRILRAIKFAARLGFDVEEKTYQAIVRHRAEITKCSQPRVLEELYRLLRGGAARRSMELLAETGVADSLSQHLARLFGSRSDAELDLVTQETAPPEDSGSWESVWQKEATEEVDPEPLELFIPSYYDAQEHDARMDLAWNLLGQVDRMVAEGRPTSNALVLAAAVAAFVVPDLLDESLRPAEASDMVDEVLQPLVKEIGIARRDAERTNQILLAQRRLIPPTKRRTKPMAFVKRDYFDEALTIYELLASAQGEVASELSFWRKLQVEGGAEPNAQTQRKRRRGGRRRRRQ